jgi:uncharacterized tellurite resistance protein B-like protein
MIDFGKLFGFAGTTKPDPDLGELFAGMSRILEGRAEQEIRLITGYAGLLGKVAYADMEITEVEMGKVRDVLAGRLSLSAEVVELIVELLGQLRARLYNLEDYVYLRMVNDATDKHGRMELLGALFEVAAADESICAEEDATLWTIAKGLRLSHREFISVRAGFQEYLDVLK